MSVDTVPALLAGPTVRAAVEPGERGRFDQEFRTALAFAMNTFDVEQVAEVVRRWWTVVGGDPAVAQADRDKAARMAHLTQRHWGESRPIYVPAVVVDRTGPAVRAALTGGDLATFEAEVQQALREAAASFDHRPAVDVITRWWAVAITLANPNDLAQDLATARELAAIEAQR